MDFLADEYPILRGKYVVFVFFRKLPSYFVFTLQKKLIRKKKKNTKNIVLKGEVMSSYVIQSTYFCKRLVSKLSDISTLFSTNIYFFCFGIQRSIVAQA